MRSTVIIELPDERVEKVWPTYLAEWRGEDADAGRLGQLLAEALLGLRLRMLDHVVLGMVSHIVRRNEWGLPPGSVDRLRRIIDLFEPSGEAISSVEKPS